MSQVKKGSAGRPNGGPPRLDAANLAGVTTLMNMQNVRAGLALGDAEKSVMGKGRTPKRGDVDPVSIYTAELSQLAEELGIDLLDGGASPPKPVAPTPSWKKSAPAAAQPRTAAGGRPTGAGGRPTPSSQIANLIDDLDLDFAGKDAGVETGSSAGDEASEGSGSTSSGCDCESCDEDCDCGCHESEGSFASETETGSEAATETESEAASSTASGTASSSDESRRSRRSHRGRRRASGSAHGSARGARNRGRGGGRGGRDEEQVDDIISRLENDLGIRTDQKKRRHAVEVSAPERRDRAPNLTEEQERRRHINSVVTDIRGETRTTFGVERERLEDLKASKLEQISRLRVALEEEGISCDNVGKVTEGSPPEVIDSVLNILRLKNDRNRYSSLAEEVLLGGAEFLETLFDGSRAIPVLGWRPDYTGYSTVVNSKLHRMRFETSQIVGDIISRFNIGAGSRIIMELLPSFFLYPRQQRRQRGTPGLSSDPHVADARSAYAAIREADLPKGFDDISSI